MYQTNATKVCSSTFNLIALIIVVHVVKHQSVINKYMQKAGEPIYIAPENDAGFLKVIRIAAVHKL